MAISKKNIVAENETESTRSMRIDGKVVIVELAVRKNKYAEPVNLTAHLNFEGVTASQILLWAARTKVIDLQRALRLCETDFLKDLAKRGPIRRKASEAGTAFVDPSKVQQQIISTVDNMSAEERAALIAELQKRM